MRTVKRVHKADYKPIANLITYSPMPTRSLDERDVIKNSLLPEGSDIVESLPADFRRIVRYIEEKKIRPLVGGAYRLSDFHRAQADFVGKEFVGKLVVVPGKLVATWVVSRAPTLLAMPGSALPSWTTRGSRRRRATR